ncbi:MAG: inositol monophosphatase [Pseudomonadota bacterium]
MASDRSEDSHARASSHLPGKVAAASPLAPDIVDEGRLTTARTIVDRAAVLALDYFERRDGLDVATKRSPQDLVTEADKAVEMQLFSDLAAAFPEDGRVGEETGGDVARSYWLVDPIDGTSNFVSGLPFWGISLAYVVESEPTIGILAFPAMGRTYWAKTGGGAFCNGKRLFVSKTADMGRSRIIFGRSPNLPPDGAHGFAKRVMEADGAIYSFGACAFNLAMVAEGSCDGYFEERVFPWDSSAGVVLVREAGGSVRFSPPDDVLAEGGPIMASGPSLFPALGALAYPTD